MRYRATRQGRFYASKDNIYPTKSGGTRRINWGWAQVVDLRPLRHPFCHLLCHARRRRWLPASTQTLPHTPLCYPLCHLCCAIRCVIQVKPASTQTLPREITFNAAARSLQQYPIAELDMMRGPSAAHKVGGGGWVNG